MLQQFKTFLKVQNLLLENSNLTLNESTEIAQFIIDTIEEYNKEREGTEYKDKTPFTKLEINTNLPNIQEVNIGDQENTLIITMNGKKQQIKIGKLLRQLLPNARDEDIEKLNYKIKEKIMEKFNALNDYEFIIDNDVVKWYEYCEDNYVGSCMTDYGIIESDVLKLYDVDNNIKILLIKNKKELNTTKNDILEPNSIIARALVWYNTSLGKPFIDRLYVHEKLNYMDIYNIMILWAKKNNYAYRGPGRDNRSISNASTKEIIYKISENIWEKLNYLPYMDTLCYLDITEQTISNIKSENSIELHDSDGLNIIKYKIISKVQKSLKNIENNIVFELRNKNISSVELENEDEIYAAFQEATEEEVFNIYKLENKILFNNKNYILFDSLSYFLQNNDRIALAFLKFEDGTKYNIANCIIWFNTNYEKPVFGNIFIYKKLLNLKEDIISKIENLFINFLKSKGFNNYKEAIYKKNITVTYNFYDMYYLANHLKDKSEHYYYDLEDSVEYKIDFFNSINNFGELKVDEVENYDEKIEDYIKRLTENYNEAPKDFLNMMLNHPDEEWYDFVESKDDPKLKKIIKFLDREYKNLIENYNLIEENFRFINGENFLYRDLAIKEDEKWNNGILIDAIWKNNFWNNGLWVDGLWINGEWRYGKWLNGVWKNGQWYNGFWYNGIWENGTWINGHWYNGVWKNGQWNNGYWKNGEWWGGEWIRGYIYTPKVDGYIEVNLFSAPKEKRKKFNPNVFKKIDEQTSTFEELIKKLKEFSS